MTTRLLRSPVSTALLLAAALALPSLALAGEARVGSVSLRSTPYANGAYGAGVVAGRGTLTTDAGTGTTSVVVRVEGLLPGTTHIGHIHAGNATTPCASLQPGTIIENLGPFTANAHGVAVARTVIDTPTAGVADCEWWVAVHEGSENTDPQSPAIAVGPVSFVETDDGD